MAEAAGATTPAARYIALVLRRPGLWLGVWLLSGVALAAIGSRLGVRSNLEDLFPDDTPAVVAAREARDILPSSNQMVVIFGSPSREANRAFATAFCAEATKMGEIAGVECQRDVAFFRRNAALWLDIEELQRIDGRVRAAIQDATRDALVDPALTEGLSAPAAVATTGDAEGDDPADDFGDREANAPAARDAAETLDSDPADDFAAGEPAPASATAAVDSAPPGTGRAANEESGTGVASGGVSANPAQAASATGSRLAVPSDDEIGARFGKVDLREWSESPDGTVLGVKLFPRVKASDVDAAAALTSKVRALLRDLQPTRHHAEMQTAIRGDYAEMSAEVANIRTGLVLTSILAIVGIALVQIVAFRSLRALIVVMTPLVIGAAWSLAFAQLAIGYVNLITAFIFSILFGLGNEFGVYALSRYRESRARGLDVDAALRDAMPQLGAGMRTSAFTTAAAFMTLTLFDFRGFSQYGLLAGSGVLLALCSTLLVTPPLVAVLHRLWPEGAVSPESTRGLRWLGAVTSPKLARVVLALVAVAAVAALFAVQDLRFDTNFRKLKTQAPANDANAASSAAPPPSTEAKLGQRFRSEASETSLTPILVVTDDIHQARQVHDWLLERRHDLTRISQFLSIHTFLPQDQERKAAIARQIYQLLADKHAALGAEDAAEAKRAMELLQPTPFGAEQLPEFVRSRFLDNHGGIGRYVLLYANGNRADARSVQQIVDQVGKIDAGGRTYRATASFFMLAEADGVIRREGPRAVLLAALTVLIVVFLQLRSLGKVLATFVPLAVAVLIFLGTAPALGLELNLFTITVLPSIFGLGIDGTVHLVHRGWDAESEEEVRDAAAKVGGAAWIAALTTVIGFAALWFQDNPGIQTLGSMAVAGLLITTQVGNAVAAAWVGLRVARRLRTATRSR